jgi:hypothetical protein
MKELGRNIMVNFGIRTRLRSARQTSLRSHSPIRERRGEDPRDDNRRLYPEAERHEDDAVVNEQRKSVDNARNFLLPPFEV